MRTVIFITVNVIPYDDVKIKIIQSVHREGYKSYCKIMTYYLSYLFDNED